MNATSPAGSERDERGRSSVPSGWRVRLRYRDIILEDRWFPAGARVTAGEATHATFVTPALAGDDGRGALALIEDGRLLGGAVASVDAPARVSPPGLPEVALELWPEARGASPPGARAGWRDLAQIVTLGLAAALVVVFVARLEPSPRAPEPRASIPAPGDRGDLSPVVWAMFYGSVIDPAADPRREPSARARGDRSRVGAGVAGDASPYEDWFEHSGPLPGEDDDSRAAVELPPTRAEELDASGPAEPGAGNDDDVDAGELTPASEGRGGEEDGLGTPGEGAPRGERDADAPARDVPDGRAGDPAADPNAKGRGRGIAAIERELVGRHRFGVQFIWEGYGRATITRAQGALQISGEQRNHEGDYVTLHGVVRVVDERNLEITGTLEISIARCCGTKAQTGTFRFERSGRRKFWRLQNPHKERFCSKYQCHYYVDLFARR